MSDEKRRFSRVVFKMKAELAVAGILYKVEEIANLSVGGCQLDIGEEIAPGAECSFLLVLNPADRRSNVEVAGEVVRSESGNVGIKFTSIGPEALVHLQNIIRYNSSDPDRIEEEIDERPGLL